MEARVALVDGAPAMRHARQLMLRAEGFDVRAYASATPLLNDPLARDSACVVAEVDMPEIDGVALLRAMRRQGWHGAAILLADGVSDQLTALAIDQDFTVIVPTGLADRILLAEVIAAIARCHARGAKSSM